MAETRELLERLVARLGHELVDADADVVLFEPVGTRSWSDVRALHPRAQVVVASIEPGSSAGPDDPPSAAWLLKPFSPGELRRALDVALSAAPAPAPA